MESNWNISSFARSSISNAMNEPTNIKGHEGYYFEWPANGNCNHKPMYRMHQMENEYNSVVREREKH